MPATASARPAPSPAPAFTPDPAALQRLLDGEHAALRERIKQLLAEPRFAYRYGLPKEAYRELVYEWLQVLAAEGLGKLAYPEVAGGDDDPAAFFAAFEAIAFHDLSLTIKFGVQFGLFGGSVALLGTERHHRTVLPRIGSGELPGCFAMTEIGHGSNVREIRTEARWDAAAGEFVVHTPDASAWKEWIGNAAVHGRMATVFAQLHVGGTCHGVHALLVPLRDEAGRLLPGVQVRDSGEKLGLNGVDNGQIAFDHVRVPREALLDRFGRVTEAGTYESAIANPGKRFFTMISTLVGGRITIAASALSAAKSGLAIAVRYGARRRQFGPQPGQEVPLLDYLTHQRRLLLPLARTYALDFGIKRLVRDFQRRTAATEREMEGLAAGLKAVATWHTGETLQLARECCGGVGYRAENRIGVLRADTDIFQTFEGDNTVLMQLLAKGLLTGYREHLGGLGFTGLVRYLARATGTRLARRNAVVSRLTDEEHLRDPAFQLGALRYREERLLRSAARRLKGRLDDGMDAFGALIEVQDHLLHLAGAHIDRVVHEAFRDAIPQVGGGTREALLRLADLYALSMLERHEGWYLANGLFEAPKAKAIRAQVNALCAELRPHAVALVDGFGIPDALLAAPIALGDG
ncbi:MAG: acyl-CoA dehydrogenase [Gemmatimonadales bacterium]|nr:acyl-CoA dehydrogenase [Gemmatimonadales bacterium]